MAATARALRTPIEEEAADPPAAARAAGLRYVDCSQPGLRRRRTGKKVRVGKRWVPAFVFEDASGRVVRDRDDLERIRALAIPPAWTDVWICPTPRRPHPGHRPRRARAASSTATTRAGARSATRPSTSRMIAFGEALPAHPRAGSTRDLALPGPAAREGAGGGRAAARDHPDPRRQRRVRARERVLRPDHAARPARRASSGSKLRFRFRGKSGKSRTRSTSRDRRLARVVRRCQDLPGQELFQYLDDDGRAPRPIELGRRQRLPARDRRRRRSPPRTSAPGPAPCWPPRRSASSRRSTVRGRRPSKQRRPRRSSRSRRGWATRRPSAASATSTPGHRWVPGRRAGRATARGGTRTAGLAPWRARCRLLRRRQSEEKRGTRLTRQLRRSLRLVRWAIAPKGSSTPKRQVSPPPIQLPPITIHFHLDERRHRDPAARPGVRARSARYTAARSAAPHPLASGHRRRVALGLGARRARACAKRSSTDGRSGSRDDDFAADERASSSGLAPSFASPTPSARRGTSAAGPPAPRPRHDRRSSARR